MLEALKGVATNLRHTAKLNFESGGIGDAQEAAGARDGGEEPDESSATKEVPAREAGASVPS